MKINTRICDVCDKEIYQHAKHTYTIRKKFPETDLFSTRMDLCEDCWNKFKKWVKENRSINKKEK